MIRYYKTVAEMFFAEKNSRKFCCLSTDSVSNTSEVCSAMPTLQDPVKKIISTPLQN